MDSVIVRTPGFLSGQPRFRGTRCAPGVLFDNLVDGMSLHDILDAYPALNRADCVAALEQACEMLSAAAPEVKP